MDSAKQILNMTYPISGDINRKTIQKAYGKLGLIETKLISDKLVMYMKMIKEYINLNIMKKEDNI